LPLELPAEALECSAERLELFADALECSAESLEPSAR